MEDLPAQDPSLNTVRGTRAPSARSALLPGLKHE